MQVITSYETLTSYALTLEDVRSTRMYSVHLNQTAMIPLLSMTASVLEDVSGVLYCGAPSGSFSGTEEMLLFGVPSCKSTPAGDPQPSIITQTPAYNIVFVH